MADVLRWGILGTGSIAATFASDLALSGAGVVAAVGSRRGDTARAFAQRFGIGRAHVGYEALVADDNLDVIYVATPHPMHVANATLALEHAKPVLVEKPFAMNAAEARVLVARARSSSLFMMEAMWTRFLPHVVALRELVADGTLGEVVLVEADHGQWFERDRRSRLFAPELGGGALLDLGIYPVSFASMLLGPPGSVSSLVTAAFSGVDATTSMLFGYDSGAQALLTCTSSARGATRACITGTRARVEIDGDFYAPSSFTVIERTRGSRRYEFPVLGRGLHYEAREVSERLHAGELESALMPLDETVSIMTTLDEVARVACRTIDASRDPTA